MAKSSTGVKEDRDYWVQQAITVCGMTSDEASIRRVTDLKQAVERARRLSIHESKETVPPSSPSSTGHSSTDESKLHRGTSVLLTPTGTTSQGDRANAHTVSGGGPDGRALNKERSFHDLLNHLQAHVELLVQKQARMQTLYKNMVNDEDFDEMDVHALSQRLRSVQEELTKQSAIYTRQLSEYEAWKRRKREKLTQWCSELAISPSDVNLSTLQEDSRAPSIETERDPL